MSIMMSTRGSMSNIDKFLKSITRGDIWRSLNAEAQKGLVALKSATPIDTGLTADAWDYRVEKQWGNWVITWSNFNYNRDVNIAIILQFGHGTGTGGYVAGRNYIPPSIGPVFNDISDQVWREVTNA